MKILHLSSEQTWRGGEQQIAYLIDELNLRGIQNVVACRKNSAFAHVCHEKAWPYCELSFKNSFDLSTAWFIKKLCRKESIDLMHIHSAKSHGIAVLSAMLGNPTPLVLSRRVDFPIRSNRMTQWKYNHPAVVKIIAVSRAIEAIVRSSVRQPERCTTVYSGIDTSRFDRATGYLRERYQLAPDTLLIANTSALADHKDYVTFVDTAREFKKFDIPAKFFIIGSGPLHETIHQYITRHQLQDDVLMTGFLTNLSEVLPELDLFLITSKTEGLGTSVLDAFACRIPVVATRAGGIPEMVIHEQTGLLADIGDAAALASHLHTLVSQPALRRKLAEAAYQHLLKNFTKEKMASETLQVYRSVL